jgi:hypothetical protein
MAINWITAFKLIPWRDVVENAPTVLGAAKKLWDKRAAGPEPAPGPERERDSAPNPAIATLQQEVASLKEEAARTAELLKALAEQNTRLVEAVDVLRVRTRFLLYTTMVLVVWAIALAVVLAIR